MESRLLTASDAELMVLLQDGRLEAFAQLVRRYEQALLRVAQSRLSDRQLAEDAVQESLLCVFRSRGTFVPTANFRTWLWTILLNQCRCRAKRASRQPRILSWTDAAGDEDSDAAAATPPLAREDGPQQLLLTRERSERLAALLMRLPELEADAVRLRFFAGLKYREIAETMGCSLLTAKNRVKRALQRIATWIREEPLSNDGDWP